MYSRDSSVSVVTGLDNLETAVIYLQRQSIVSFTASELILHHTKISIYKIPSLFPRIRWQEREAGHHLHLVPNLRMRVAITLSTLYTYMYFPLVQKPDSALGCVKAEVLEITFRHTSVGMTPPSQGSARLRCLYLTTHNSH